MIPTEPGTAAGAPAKPGAALAHAEPATPALIALLGNPNTGKTTLFNRLTGLRHKTSNFPGTTLEGRVGRLSLPGVAPGEAPAALLDLPGVYSIELDLLESRIAREALAGRTLSGQGAAGLMGEGRQAGPAPRVGAEPDAVCVVLDATNLARNLRLAGEALRRRLPTVVAVNMIDLARNRGLSIDATILSRELGCGVVLVNARDGEGCESLRAELARARVPSRTPPGDDHGLSLWAQEMYAAAASRAPDSGHAELADSMTDRADRVLTHPVLGLGVFILAMSAIFYAIFVLAQWPMDLISGAVGALADLVRSAMPPGLLTDLLTGGILDGVGTVLVFLPQICILFFLISLLEDTGYLARGAFLMDRLLRPFGLPGHAFVPLLSSHACALPGIIACRAVPDPKERLATILVAPFMSCSARLPVYALLTGILFPGSPGQAALAFIGCYALGIFAGVLSALVARRTILRGRARPMALELPSYKRPSLRTAAVTTWDRALVFIKSAGTNILAICVVLWWLGAFPRLAEPDRIEFLRSLPAQIGVPVNLPAREGTPVADLSPEQVRRRIDDMRDTARLIREDPFQNQSLGAMYTSAADLLEASLLTPETAPARLAQWENEVAELQLAHQREQKRRSYLGQLGHAIQPVLAPLGADWQLSVGVIASFAAREVFAGTMAVVITGEEDAEAEGVLDQIAAGRRDDGTPIFTPPVAWALLVYYVLAMQCLPTLVVTARETGGGWTGFRWAMVQFLWMSGLAYVAGALVFALAG
ncbi:MAG: ferrous iron transporter B [Phycisphaerales bacterium]